MDRPAGAVERDEAGHGVLARRVLAAVACPGTHTGASGVPTLTLYGLSIAAVCDGNSATPSQKIFTVSTWRSPGLLGLA